MLSSLFSGTAQIVACSWLISYLLGISLTTAAIITMLTVTIYMYAGGMWGVVITDVAQWALGVLGIVLLLFSLTSRFGGVEFLAQHVPKEFFGWPAGKIGWGIIDGNWQLVSVIGLFFGIGIMCTYPTSYYWMRMAAARTQKDAMRGLTLAAVFALVFFSFQPAIIGLFSKSINPTLEPKFAMPFALSQVNIVAAAD